MYSITEINETKLKLKGINNTSLHVLDICDNTYTSLKAGILKVGDRVNIITKEPYNLSGLLTLQKIKING